MTDLLTITIRAIAPDPYFTLSKPEKGARGRLILCEGDRLKPLNCKAFKLLVTPSAPCPNPRGVKTPPETQTGLIFDRLLLKKDRSDESYTRPIRIYVT
ncbi:MULTISPECIES: hypothetical protein [unclassified Microcoleus]